MPPWLLSLGSVTNFTFSGLTQQTHRGASVVNIKKIPLIGEGLRYVYRKWINPPSPFLNSQSYWDARYKAGGNSGIGSYNELADYKAETVNSFVARNNVRSIIEYGCGDGNQLSLATYPTYVGFDVSEEAVARCRKKFLHCSDMRFETLDNYRGETAELTLSLDVIYHLVEDQVFTDYIERLFDSAEHFVIVYSSNTDENLAQQAEHVKHRRFSDWVTANRPEWKLKEYIQNKYPIDVFPEIGSWSDFFIFERCSG